MSSIVAYCCTYYLAKGCLPRICLRGKVFILPLPSNGSIRHNMHCLDEWITTLSFPLDLYVLFSWKIYHALHIACYILRTAIRMLTTSVTLICPYRFPEGYAGYTSIHSHITGINNLTYLLMELSSSWGAANYAAPRELSSILWNPKVDYRVHKSPPLVPILIN
jgi:hypothetical protein